MFSVGDKVVHPMHGAGVIANIAAEKIAGAVREYYVFKMSVSGLVLKIPVLTSHLVGLRRIVNTHTANELMSSLSRLEVDMSSNWNRRYRENMQRLKSGDLYEVARVIKCLIFRDNERGLSNGERKMLHSAKQILISEMVLVMEKDYQVIENQLIQAISGEMAG